MPLRPFGASDPPRLYDSQEVPMNNRWLALAAIACCLAATGSASAGLVEKDRALQKLAEQLSKYKATLEPYETADPARPAYRIIRGPFMFTLKQAHLAE